MVFLSKSSKRAPFGEVWLSRKTHGLASQEVKFDNITKRIRTLCDGLDPRFIDPVPVTQKVVEGAGLIWDLNGDRFWEAF